MHNGLQIQPFWFVGGRRVEAKTEADTIKSIVCACQRGGTVANVVEGDGLERQQYSGVVADTSMYMQLGPEMAAILGISRLAYFSPFTEQRKCA